MSYEAVFVIAFFVMLIGIGIAVWGAQNYAARREQRDDFQRAISQRQMELDAWKQEALRRSDTPIQSHSEQQRRAYYAAQDEMLEVYRAHRWKPDTDTEKPKREPRYAIGDDGELIAVTDDEKPKRGAM